MPAISEGEYEGKLEAGVGKGWDAMVREGWCGISVRSDEHGRDECEREGRVREAWPWEGGNRCGMGMAMMRGVRDAHAERAVVHLDHPVTELGLEVCGDTLDQLDGGGVDDGGLGVGTELLDNGAEVPPHPGIERCLGPA